MIEPKDIENRQYGIVPLSGGLDFTESKALVAPGTLQDALNYEVKSRGYSRAQGLLLYHGTYDYAVENMWYIGDLNANLTITGAAEFTLGGEVTWATGSGICIYWKESGAGQYKALGVVDVEGDVPTVTDTFTDVETGTTFEVTVAPATLGTAVYPHTSALIAGTITDYLAFINTVNTTVAAQTADTWPAYKPRIPGIGAITGGFQFKDNVYACRDYPGVGFYQGSNKPLLKDELSIPLVGGGTFLGTVAGVDLQAGSWENGDAAGAVYFEPSAGGTNNGETFATIDDLVALTNTTQSNTTGTVLQSRNSNKGHLWKASIDGWTWIDPGHSLRFKDGVNPPSAQVAPLFLPSIAGATSSVSDTGWVTVSTAEGVGDTGVYSVFNNLGNLYADDAAYADSTISASGLSQLIEANALGYIPAEDTEIIGVEVRFEGAQTVGTDAYIASLRLVNDSANQDPYQSDDVADDTFLDGVQTVYTVGGQTDLWGMTSMLAEDFNSGDIKVQVQFGNSNVSSTRTVEVDYIQIKVHYIARGQALWFWDGTTDVAEGSVYSFEKHDGNWYSLGPPVSGGDATGYMSFHNINNPEAITAGLVMRTAESGGGEIIATVAGDLSRNLQPSEAELTENSSRWEVIEANFYQNDEGAAMYGVTGADSGFIFDEDDHFAFIRTPVARRKDKPRHVAFQANHLVYGLNSGHILVSAIDAPNDFDTSGTATTWSFRDPVTGLTPLSGNALGVMCRESVHALVGTQAPSDTSTDPFRPQHITPKSGALEYTVADVMGPMYADFSGVGNLDASDKFGDFSPGRLTGSIEDWTRERFQKQPSSELANRGPVVGIPVRAKNQYRVYFEDGYILSLFVGSPERRPEAMLGHLDPTNLTNNYVPTWADSTVLSTGRERVVMGDKNGDVWIVDGANGIQTAAGLTEIPCYITTNPMNTGYPQGSTKTYAWTVIGDFMGAQDLTTTTGYDYLDVSSTSDRTKTVGSYADAPIFDTQPALTDIYTGVYTDGVSLKIQTSMDGSKPHTLHTLLHRFSHKGSGRNNTTINRG